MLRFGRQDFHLVAALQLMAQGHQLMVHLGSDTVGPQERMDAEGKVQCRTSCRHCLDFALRGEHEDL